MHVFSNTHYVACQTCGVLHPCVGSGFGHDASLEQEAIESYQQFCSAHAEHHMSELSRPDSDSFADRPLWDPMASTTFEVTDGRQTYIVVSSRATIEEARTYRFVPGSLEMYVSDISIEVQDIRRGLDYALYPHALRQTKIDRFLTVLREVISHMDPKELAIVFDAADDPEVSIACIPDAYYAELLGRCTEIFDGWELSRVSSFLEINRGEAGLLALRVRRQHRAVSSDEVNPW